MIKLILIIFTLINLLLLLASFLVEKTLSKYYIMAFGFEGSFGVGIILLYNGIVNGLLRKNIRLRYKNYKGSKAVTCGILSILFSFFPFYIAFICAMAFIFTLNLD